jgi:hypothetical protein
MNVLTILIQFQFHYVFNSTIESCIEFKEKSLNVLLLLLQLLCISTIHTLRIKFMDKNTFKLLPYYKIPNHLRKISAYKNLSQIYEL